ncbi:unnamed protein product [Calypogeia fissa]
MDGRRDGVALFRLPTMVPRRQPDPPSAWAFGLIATGVLLLVVFLYAAIVSKMLPPTGIFVLDALRADWYYNLLVPLTIPTMVVAVYLHWLSMKLFKHA